MFRKWYHFLSSKNISLFPCRISEWVEIQVLVPFFKIPYANFQPFSFLIPSAATRKSVFQHEFTRYTDNTCPKFWRDRIDSSPFCVQIIGWGFVDPCLYDSSGSDFDSLTFLTNFADLDLFRDLSIPSISYCEDSQNVKLNRKLRQYEFRIH